MPAMSADLPDPYAHRDEPTIGPDSPQVMEQVFWLELPYPPQAVGQPNLPDGVTLLDKTKPADGRTFTRLYLRADRGITGGQIGVAVEGRGTLSVPLQVLTYREDIERNIQIVRGVDPTARKQGRSYYSDDLLAVAQANLDEHPELVDTVKRKTRFEGMSDAELFAALPSWNVPRQCYSNWPCPTCGDEVFKTSGFYPWHVDRGHPFKAQCPVCKEWYPSNDWAGDDFTSGDAPDDGWGNDLGTGDRAKAAGWVAYYNHRALWEGVGRHIHRLAMRYLLLGDEESAHRAAVLLARMAYVYPGMNMRWQQVRTKYKRPGRLLVDGNWERNDILVPAAKAYDAIFDHIEQDAQLVEFLKTKDPAIQSPADVKALIDTYLIQVFGWDWMRRELSGGNMGAREEDMAQFAVCANMGPISDRWIEELFTHAYNSGGNRGGFDDETLINTTTREGVVWISAFGYAIGYVPSKSDMAEILSRVDSPRRQSRCNLYDPLQYPKFRAEYDTWIDFLVAGQFAPSYGDSGAGRGARYPRGAASIVRESYERAYRRWPTDRIARAIYRLGKRKPSLFVEDIWPQVEAQAKELPPEPPAKSRVMDGVGFAFLESRPDAPDLKARAGIAVRYGYGRGHHHNDNLNIELFAKGFSLAPELGYPCWAHPMGNTQHVTLHNTGMIDRKPQYPGCISHGDLEMFASAPEASFVDISAQPAGFTSRTYRRALCLADAPGGNVYLLDIFRMAGGDTRTLGFHGPAYDDFQSSLEFSGDLGGDEEAAHLRRGLANNLVDLEVAADDGDVWADWKHDKGDVHLRLDYLGRPGRRYFIAQCAKPDIPSLRFLFAEEEAEDGASEFISVWQPYEQNPFIEKIEKLPVTGAPTGEFQPVAVRVTLAGGQVDTFIYTFSPQAALKCGDIQFKGSFGYWSELNGKPRAAHVVNGGYLRVGETVVEAPQPAFDAGILAVDYDARTVTLDRSLPVGDALKGRLIYITGGSHRTAYHIEEVLPPGDRVRLDLNAIIYRSKMTGVSEDSREIICEIPPPIEEFRGFKPGYYDGATVTGEDKAARYRVVGVTGRNIKLERPIDSSHFPDADGDGRQMVSIYDMGPGDGIRVPVSVFRRFGN